MRYVAIYLDRAHPIVQQWSREHQRPARERWAIRFIDAEGVQEVPVGWEMETFASWTSVRRAILWLEKHDGTAKEWRRTRRRYKD